MIKHFELTNDTIILYGRTLHRIRATRDLPDHDVKAGDLGGFVERLDNLSDDAWVAHEAYSFGNALVSGNARVSNDAWVFGNALVSGNARVYDNAQVYGNAQVTDYARVSGNARVFGDARVAEEKHIMIGTLCTNRQFNWTLYRTTDGHVLHIGCKSGTLDDHQTICDSDTWVETTDPEIIRDARPEYQYVIDLCRARVARWNN